MTIWHLIKNLSHSLIICGVLMLTFFLQTSASLATGTWDVVGEKGFSSSAVYRIDVSVNSTGVPYMSYQDGANASRATVKKFNGTIWETVGTEGFSGGATNGRVSLVIDQNDVPYVAYSDQSDSEKVTVKKFNGTLWETVGAEGFSSGGADYVDVTIDVADIIYVAYSDDANAGKATVKRFNGTLWETVGVEGFSDGISNAIRIAIDSTGIPYVVYRDDAYSYGLVVKKFNGSAWETVGANNFSGGSANYVDLALDSNDVPYVAYREYDQNSGTFSLRLKKFDGNSWNYVGTSAIINGSTEHTSLVLDHIDRPFIAVRDQTGGAQQLTVMMYEDDAWESLTGVGVSDGGVEYTSLTISDSGILHVGYADQAYANKSTMMKFIVPNLPPTITVTEPDGVEDVADDSFTIAWTDDDADNNATIALYYDTDNAGQDGTLIVENISEDDLDDSYVWNTLALDEGSYYVYAVISDGFNDPVVDYSEGAVTIDHAWEVVGERGFSGTEVFGTDLAIDQNDNLYIGYPDSQNGLVLDVQKFDGTSWSFVGAENISGGGAIFVSVETNSLDEIYVAYRDSNSSDKATVKKFNGTDWEVVGLAGFSDGSANWIHMVFDSGNVPYVAYRDGSSGNKVTVKKFNGSDWITVGTEGFSTGSLLDGVKMAVDNNDNPYVVYGDQSLTGKVVVKKFNGSSWVTVGTEGFSGNNSSAFSIMVDDDNVPYVIYADGDLSSKAVVRKFDGLNWGVVGTEGFSLGAASNASITKDNLGNIYVGYRDSGLSDSLSVKKYNGIDWENIGSPGFPGRPVGWNGDLISGSDRTLYYSFPDGTSAGESKATVMQFLQPNSPPSITITQPDGVNDTSTGTFNIQWTDEDLDNDATIALYYDTDSAGQDGTLIVSGISEDDATDSYTWNTSTLVNGDYYVYAIINDGTNSDVIAYSSEPVNVSNDPGGGDPPPDLTGTGIFEQGNGGMYYDGNIGIGTGSTLPLGERLMVNGRIKAHELILENTGWADFVFADDYALLTPKELERFIEINGHLPGIPSSEEIDSDGVAIGSMQPKLLQKIEELTLYMIQMWKENMDLRERLEVLEN